MNRTLAAVVATLAAPAQAGINSGSFFSSIPALDEIGLGILIALVAGAAGWAVRRRNRK